MDFLDFMAKLEDANAFRWGLVVVFVLASFLEVSKIKINPWSWLVRKIGHAANKELTDKIDGYSDEVSAIRQDIDTFKTQFSDDILNIREDIAEGDADTRRTRILRFSDELAHNVRHSKEHFEMILADVDQYLAYCDSHPNYKNSVTELATERIKMCYVSCQEQGDWL